MGISRFRFTAYAAVAAKAVIAANAEYRWSASDLIKQPPPRCSARCVPAIGQDWREQKVANYNMLQAKVYKLLWM
jgi:hypothetical protein